MKWPDDFINKIICGDCLEVMKEMPDNCVDLILSDPPYGTNIDYGKGVKDSKATLKQLIQKAMPHILRIGKRALLTCGTANIHMYPQPDWILAWVVPAGANYGPWGFSCWQPILAYGKDPYLENKMGGRPDIIIHTEASARLNHPCPKPDIFWERLLLRGSVKEEDIIFDPFLGSGTTAQICKLTHRNFIGIEINPDYCEVAEERLAQGVL